MKVGQSELVEPTKKAGDCGGVMATEELGDDGRPYNPVLEALATPLVLPRRRAAAAAAAAGLRPPCLPSGLPRQRELELGKSVMGRGLPAEACTSCDGRSKKWLVMWTSRLDMMGAGDNQKGVK